MGCLNTWSREYVVRFGGHRSKSLISLDASWKGRECQYGVHMWSEVYAGKQHSHNGH